jgi:NADH-quinone oxidoreductase subunit J
MYLGIYVALSLIIAAGAAFAMFSKVLTRSVVALGASSACLATLFFLLDAPYAGAFELSVGAGLISVLFIIGLSLMRSLREYSDAE